MYGHVVGGGGRTPAALVVGNVVASPSSVFVTGAMVLPCTEWGSGGERRLMIEPFLMVVGGLNGFDSADSAWRIRASLSCGVIAISLVSRLASAILYPKLQRRSLLFEDGF